MCTRKYTYIKLTLCISCVSWNGCLRNNVFVNMIMNYVVMYVSEIKVCIIRLFIKALQINRPFISVTRKITTIDILKKLSSISAHLFMSSVYRTVSLVAYFAFMRLDNMAPPSVPKFDPSRHLTAEVIRFCDKYVKLKWSKTIQTGDTVHVITLPRFKRHIRLAR